MSYCPYCSLAHTQSAGELFCSRHMNNFDGLENGIFHVKGNNIHSDPHYSRFGLRFIVSGRMDFTIDGTHYPVNSKGVLLFDQYSSYQLDIYEGREEAAHIGLAFRPSFIKSAALYLHHTDRQLLELPDADFSMPVNNFRFWPLSAKAQHFRERLAHNIAAGSPGGMDAVNDIASDMLQWYIEEHSRYNRLLPRFKQSVKASTRHELLRRLDSAREAMEYAGGQQDLDVVTLAKVAGFSEFHFIRLFKEVFGLSPYQFIIKKKMVKAFRLLRETDMPVKDIAFICGYSDHAAFSRTFRMFHKCSPTEARKRF